MALLMAVVGCNSMTAVSTSKPDAHGIWMSNDPIREYLLTVGDTNAIFVNRYQRDTMRSASFTLSADSVTAWFIPSTSNAIYLGLRVSDRLVGTMKDSSMTGVRTDTVSFSRQ